MELGEKTLAMPTAGNAGSAWAAYCARAGIELHVVMPDDTPVVNMREVSACGAKLHLVDGQALRLELKSPTYRVFPVLLGFPDHA